MRPEVLETLEFPEALARVAAHAAGPLGAARVAARQPTTDAAVIRAALAQVAELAALLITDDSMRAEPVPDITRTLELLTVAGSALEGPALAEMTVALAATRVVASDLKRLATAAPRTAALRVDPPPRELETTLVRSIAPDGAVLDGASRDLARARQHVRESRKRVMDKLGAILGGLDPTERADIHLRFATSKPSPRKLDVCPLDGALKLQDTYSVCIELFRVCKNPDLTGSSSVQIDCADAIHRFQSAFDLLISNLSRLAQTSFPRHHHGEHRV